MRNKIIVNIVGLLILFFAFAGTSFAATSVRLQTPASQTNQDTMNLTFVALDTVSTQTVNVDCWKKGPSDAGYSIFQSFSLPNGGNTNNCNAGFNQGNGTYNFYVSASGSTSVDTLPAVNVDFNNSKPGDPGNYKKEKIDNCTYKIWFHTADDGGKTVKVRLYRSTDTNFSVDSAHQVNELSIGSNTDGSMTNNVSPNCDTTYYYVIRAFDVYGNGSGVVGDEAVTTITVNPTTTEVQGAIPAGGGAGGQVLGTGTKTAEEKEVLGTESAKPTISPSETAKITQNPVAQATNWVLTHKKISLLTLLLLGAIAYYLYRRYKK